LFFSEIATSLLSHRNQWLDISCKGSYRSARFKLFHKFDDSAPGESLSKPKENDDVGDLADLISLLHSFLDFSYILLPGCGAPPKVTFLRVILNTVI
jgi:hypothetical protein